MLLADLAATSAALAGEPARSGKVALLAQALRRATPAELPVAVAYLSGETRQRRTGLGYAALRDATWRAAREPSLTLAEVDDTFGRIAGVAGPGSQRARRELLADLLARATEGEQRFLAGLISGEPRQGALEALVVEALAKAFEVPLASVRQAVMLAGAPGPVAEALGDAGPAGLARFTLRLGQPVQPMLAASAPDVASAMRAPVGTGDEVGVEWKLDGIRVQVHKDGDDVAVFTRSLDEITDRVPELVEVVRALPASTLVLDGETIALTPEGRPLPFQQTAARTASRADVAAARRMVPLTTLFFDALHVDGADLLGRSGSRRWEALCGAVPERLRVPRLVTAEVGAAEAFFADAVARGHEGVIVKATGVPYAAGRRGAGWVKVKPRHTLDLVVLAAEWGHGRRQGWLSNLHLGARDPVSGGFVMLGKTFKGLTDAMLAWQTEQLLARRVDLADGEGWVVRVRPELVVEVAFDGVQTSPRYPAGMALRFARVLRYRTDKSAAQADTLDTVRALHAPRPRVENDLQRSGETRDQLPRIG